MKCIFHSLMLTLIALAGAHAYAAGPQGKVYVYEGREYSSPLEACEAVAKARREDRSVDNPYGRVVDAQDADDKFFCKLADSNNVTTEQTYGSTKLAKADASTVSGTDRCLDDPANNREPNSGRCPYSWRAFDIKRELHVRDPKKWPVIALLKTAIAVSEGVLVNGNKRVTIITTNNPRLHKALSEPNGWRRASGEELGFEPVAGEHAEDTAERTFATKGIKQGTRVRMGSDPQACEDKCSKNYKRHPWITHERLSTK